MTAFVILHYRAIDTTRSCVKSIRALAGDKHIVIVDNASPDGTGKQLAEEFAASPDVTVLLCSTTTSRSRSMILSRRSRASTRSIRSTCWVLTSCRYSPASTRARKRCTAAHLRACATSVRAWHAAATPFCCC